MAPAGWSPTPTGSRAFVRSIISQQISTKAAASINRPARRDPRRAPPAGAVDLELGEAKLRHRRPLVRQGPICPQPGRGRRQPAVPLDEFDDSWDDQAITQALTAVKGIGVWTAEMFLIFALNRPDILPASDLGVRVGLRDRHGLVELPRPRDCHALAEIWRPYRTIASWYIWKGTDTPIARPVTPPAEAGRPRSRSKRRSSP